MPTSSVPRELLIADACRRAARWLRTPTSDKIPGALAVDPAGWFVFGHDPSAVKWCALGRVQHELRDQPDLVGHYHPGTGTYGRPLLNPTIFAIIGNYEAQVIAETFNAGHHKAAAVLLEQAATRLEQRIYDAQRAAYSYSLSQPITTRPGDTLDDPDDYDEDDELDTDETPARDLIPA